MHPDRTTGSKARSPWIDITRSLAMFFIMWLHIRNSPAAIHGAVEGAIFLFFTLAGYFMPTQAGPNVKRALQLAKTWVIWMILPFLFYVMGGMQWDWQHALGWGVGAYNAPLWFLRNLVLFQLIFAGLMALCLLPRHAILLCFILAGCAYVTEWPEHVCIRFDYLFALALGFAGKHFPLQSITEFIQKKRWLLLGVAAGILLQNKAMGWICDSLDIKCELFNGSLRSINYVIIYLCLGHIIADKLPKLGSYLALVGRNMLFIYVAHSLVYGFLIFIEDTWLGGTCIEGVWTPCLAMLLLTWLSTLGKKHTPLLMRALGL